MVVRQLAASGTPVLALARSLDSAAAKDLAALTNVEVCLDSSCIDAACCLLLLPQL